MKIKLKEHMELKKIISTIDKVVLEKDWDSWSEFMEYYKIPFYSFEDIRKDTQFSVNQLKEALRKLEVKHNLSDSVLLYFLIIYSYEFDEIWYLPSDY